MVNKDDYIFNHRVGGWGGDDFGDSLWRGKPVTEVEVWYGRAWDADYTVLKGLNVHWGNEQSGLRGSAPPDALHTSYSFAPGERVHWMDLYGAPPDSGGRVDALRFEANNPFAAGGPGGRQTHENPGNHVFHGFVGKGHADIDSLGAVFHKEAGFRFPDAILLVFRRYGALQGVDDLNSGNLSVLG
ncbi:hypothetical protein BDV25DRAFT_136016 [Aspergillus avenaceus]|uniref:Jacalin-type lectin domain-containing protein n=1 Tax=Aspergillus avenaceus TaxID=36643 RepID=A0A5N6U6P7_ASPAV|nr:hypothetical protein BDV25DRAFT_136016 [Aspergillus avenaceus]